MKYSASLLLLASVLLALSACGLSDIFGGAKNASPTAAPTQATTFVTYKGDGFQLDYPQNWKVSPANNGLITFSDPSGIAYVAVRTTPNPNGLVPVSDQLQIALQVFKSQAKNYQEVDGDSTTTVGGETWSQKAATGDVTPSGQSSAVNVKIVAIATNHPANSLDTKSYALAYATGTQVFDIANTAYFQPILKSFKFTA